MQTFDIFKTGPTPKTILCLGAHADDIEIGCGATLLRMLDECPGAVVHWVVLSASPARRDEAVAGAEDFLAAAGESHVSVESFRDGFFPYVGYDIKEYFEKMKDAVKPDVVFTHCRGDLHQDHRVVNELTWNTYRDHLVLEYEIPKFDGDLGSPNLFVMADRARAERKAELIWKHFGTQRDKHWFTKDNLLALMRIRGVESRAPEGFAEAFYCRKIAV